MLSLVDQKGGKRQRKMFPLVGFVYSCFDLRQRSAKQAYDWAGAFTLGATLLVSTDYWYAKRQGAKLRDRSISQEIPI